MKWNSDVEKKRIGEEVLAVLRQKTFAQKSQILFRINNRVRGELEREVRAEFPAWDNPQVAAEVNRRLDVMNESPPYIDDFPDWRELCEGTTR